METLTLCAAVITSFAKHDKAPNIFIAFFQNRVLSVAKSCYFSGRYYWVVAQGAVRNTFPYAVVGERIVKGFSCAPTPVIGVSFQG
jgi:hypothetical protein